MKGAFVFEKIKEGIKVIKTTKNWPEYFINSFNLTQKKFITLKMRNGLNYILRTKTLDKYLFAEVVLEDAYLTKSIGLPKDAVIIDLGAHIGLFSVYASGKAKKIFSFEPVPENYKVLLENISLNELQEKIVPFDLAVSNKEEKQKIFLSEKHSGSHSIYGYLAEEKNTRSCTKMFLESKGFSKKKFINAGSITLSQIFRKNRIEKCDLLKMDIEGAEYKALYSAPDSFFKKVQRIVMECHNIDENKNNLASLIEFLKSKGYKVKWNKAILFVERKDSAKGESV